MTRSEQLVSGLAEQLGEIVADLKRVEDERDELLEHRKALGLELLDLGLSERQVGELAGVSGPAVHYWREGH